MGKRPLVFLFFSLRSGKEKKVVGALPYEDAAGLGGGKGGGRHTERLKDC